WICIRDNDIDLEPDELGREFGGAVAASLRPAIVDRKVATLDPAEFAQPLHKSGDPMAVGRRRAGAQETDSRQLSRLLRPRRERPRRRRAAEQRDELATFHSITSSATDIRVGGIVRSSIRAVSAFMTSSNFEDCTTGRSAGFVPLRTRPA